MKFVLRYKIAGVIWQNGRVEYDILQHELEAQSDEDAILQAKVFLFDKGQGIQTPEILELVCIQQTEIKRKVA